MRFKRPEPASDHLDRGAALACVPLVAPGLSWQQDEQGEVLIEYPLMVKPFFHSLLARFHPQTPETKKLQLDGLGSQVWLMLDGQRQVKEIITAFAEANDLSSAEAEQAVTLFLRNLGRRGLIVLRRGSPAPTD